jgi:threonine/homoserine/homoserine lactone efflux protein
MLQLLGLLVASFLAALAGAVSPGPVFAVTVAESVKRGYRAGPLIVSGHFILEAIIVSVLFLGMGSLLASEPAGIAIGYGGGGALISMGIYLAWSSRNIRLQAERSGSHRFSSYGSIVSGFLTSCSNPYVPLWWIAIGVPIMYKSLEIAGVLGFALFLIGHGAADMGWFSSIAYCVDRGRRFMSDRFLRYLVVGSALFMVGLGIYFIGSSALA